MKPTTELEITVDTEGQEHTVEYTYTRNGKNLHVACTVSKVPSASDKDDCDNGRTQQLRHNVEHEDSTSCLPCSCIRKKKYVTHVTYEKSEKNLSSKSSNYTTQEYSSAHMNNTGKRVVDELKATFERRQHGSTHREGNPLPHTESRSASLVYDDASATGLPAYADLELLRTSTSMSVVGRHYNARNSGSQLPSTHICEPAVSSTTGQSHFLGKS